MLELMDRLLWPWGRALGVDQCVRVNNAELYAQARGCQKEVHTWGKANGVDFECTKESFHVISRSEPDGDVFKQLGVSFDTQLLMDVEISGLVAEASWKLATMLRTRRFFNDMEIIRHFKAHVLSFIEYRTAAIYHAATSVLAPLEAIHARLLRAANMTPVEALLHCRLAPLHTRRDMAMLGLIHRSLLGRGPPHFKKLFRLQDPGGERGRTRLAQARHRFQLEEFEGTQEYVCRSVLGLIRVYNLLPVQIVEASATVKDFICFARACTAQGVEG